MQGNCSHTKMSIKVIRMGLRDELCPCHQSMISISNVEHLIGEELQPWIRLEKLLELHVLPPLVTVPREVVIICNICRISLDIRCRDVEYNYTRTISAFIFSISIAKAGQTTYNPIILQSGISIWNFLPPKIWHLRRMSTELTRRRRYPRTTSNASSAFDGTATDASGSVGGDSISTISNSVFLAVGVVSNRAAGKESGFLGKVSYNGNGAAIDWLESDSLQPRLSSSYSSKSIGCSTLKDVIGSSMWCLSFGRNGPAMKENELYKQASPREIMNQISNMI